MSNIGDRKAHSHTGAIPHSRPRGNSRASAAGTGSSPVLVEHPHDYLPPAISTYRQPSSHDEDWEDIASEIQPSDSASRTKQDSPEFQYRQTRQYRVKYEPQRRRASPQHRPPPAPEPRPANQHTHRRGRSRLSEEYYSDHRDSHGQRYRSKSRQHYDRYDNEDMYRRETRRSQRYPQDRYDYDDYDRRYATSPPQSYVSPYDNYSSHVVHYQHVQPSYAYPQYAPPFHAVSPPLTAVSGSSGGYFPPIMYHYPQNHSGRAPVSSRSDVRSDVDSESVKLVQESMKKQEEHLKQMREQMEADKKERLALDKARDDAIKKREAELEAKLAKEAADKKRAEEMAAVAKEAREKAEAEAAKKAKEQDEKSKKEKEKLEKEVEESKKKEADAKKAEAEAKKEIEALKPSPDDTKPGIKFKDAGGRTWNFPWRYCKQWKTMQILISKCYQDNPNIHPQVEAQRYHLIGPNEQIIMPEIWEHTIEPGWEISMALWPQAPTRHHHREQHVVHHGDVPPPPPPLTLYSRHSHRDKKDKEKKSSSHSRSVHTTVIELPERTRSARTHEAEEGVPPPPPPGSDGADSVVEVIEDDIVELIKPKSSRRKKSPKPTAELPFMARWIASTSGRERRR